MKRSGAQIIWETLQQQGVDVLFGYPGAATLPAYDALLDYPIHHVLVRHEQGAAHMADGYARASGKVGVAMATSGPGATNLVTGIATAMMDSSPIVCISGQVLQHLIGTDGFQEVDMTGITLPVTKHNYLVTRAQSIGPALREAFYIAQSGRPGPVLVDISKSAIQETIDWEPDTGPVLVDISKSAIQETIDWEPDTGPVSLPGYRPDLRAIPEEFQRAIEMINEAKRPVILAGHGVILSSACRALLDFVEQANIPVALTLLGLGGFPASHPQNLGMMGMHGEAWVNKAIQEADLLLAFGMRFDDRVTGTLSTYAKNAKKIHVDVDPGEINKIVKVDVGLVGDLRETLEFLLPQIEPRGHVEWNSYIRDLRGDSAVRDIKYLPDDGHLYAAHVINDLWHYTDGKALIVTDVGQHQMWTAQYYRQESPRHLITSGGQGTMGFGLPAAIGAKFARPDAEVWLIAGDGGFQMTASELSTAAQEGIKVNVAIMNNGYLGMVRQWQEFFYDRRYSGTTMRSPDFVKLAQAHGLTGLRCEERSCVEEVVQQAREAEGTVVIDFRVEKEDSVYPMVPTGAALDEMIRRPLAVDVVMA